MRLFFLSFYKCNLFSPVVGVLMILNVQAQAAPETQIKELKGTEEQSLSTSQVANNPLYLSLIESRSPSLDLVEKARKALQNTKSTKRHEKLSLNPFHKRDDISLQDKFNSPEESFCLSCHLPLPHQENIRTRTFNNMHSRYIACETCHFDKEKIADFSELDYRWFDFSHQLEVNNAQSFFKMTEEKNQLTRPVAVKITPFYQQQVAVITHQHSFVRRLSEHWENAQLPVKAELKAKIHQVISSEGTNCSQCHTSKNSLLDISALGASDRQLDSFSKNSIVNFFERYGQKDKTAQKNETIMNHKDLPQENKPHHDAIQRIRITELLN